MISKEEYIKRLENKGYKKLNENQITSGDGLIFNITKLDDAWCLKLSEDSDLNLIPPAWSSSSRR